MGAAAAGGVEGGVGRAGLHEGRVDRDADRLDDVLFGGGDLEALELLKRLLEVRERADDAGLPFRVLGVGCVAPCVLDKASGFKNVIRRLRTFTGESNCSNTWEGACTRHVHSRVETKYQSQGWREQLDYALRDDLRISTGVVVCGKLSASLHKENHSFVPDLSVISVFFLTASI